jgi:hypothetical protein
MSVPRSLNYSTGYTLKTVLRDYSTGAERVWNTATPGFEAYNAANVASYGIATAEGSPGQYSWAVPSTLAASAAGYEYEATTYQLAGANLAVADLASPVWRSTFAWDGSVPMAFGDVVQGGSTGKNIVRVNGTPVVPSDPLAQALGGYSADTAGWGLSSILKVVQSLRSRRV